MLVYFNKNSLILNFTNCINIYLWKHSVYFVHLSNNFNQTYIIVINIKPTWKQSGSASRTPLCIHNVSMRGTWSCLLCSWYCSPIDWYVSPVINNNIKLFYCSPTNRYVSPVYLIKTINFYCFIIIVIYVSPKIIILFILFFINW